MIPVSSIEYVNVRVRAQHSRLFTKDTYDELISGDTLGAVTTFLLDNPEYKHDIEHALEHQSERDGLEKGVTDHFTRCVNHLYRMSDGPMRQFFTLGLSSFDLRNLRTIIIAHKRNISYHHVEHILIPCSMQKKESLRSAYELKDIGEMVNELPTCCPLAVKAINQALSDTRAQEPVVNLINRLERNLYEYILRSLDGNDENSRILKDVYRNEVDLKNIVNVLKRVWRESGMKSDVETYINGGFIPERFIRELEKSRNLDEAFEMIEKSQYHEAVEKGVIYYAETGFLHEMERFFEGVFISKTQVYKRAEPFGIGPFISYIWAQFAEMTNLKTIINGIAFKMGAGQIRKGLVNV